MKFATPTFFLATVALSACNAAETPRRALRGGTSRREQEVTDLDLLEEELEPVLVENGLSLQMTENDWDDQVMAKSVFNCPFLNIGPYRYDWSRASHEIDMSSPTQQLLQPSIDGFNAVKVTGAVLGKLVSSLGAIGAITDYVQFLANPSSQLSNVALTDQDYANIKNTVQVVVRDELVTNTIEELHGGLDAAETFFNINWRRLGAAMPDDSQASRRNLWDQSGIVQQEASLNTMLSTVMRERFIASGWGLFLSGVNMHLILLDAMARTDPAVGPDGTSPWVEVKRDFGEYYANFARSQVQKLVKQRAGWPIRFWKVSYSKCNHFKSPWDDNEPEYFYLQDRIVGWMSDNIPLTESQYRNGGKDDLNRRQGARVHEVVNDMLKHGTENTVTELIASWDGGPANAQLVGIPGNVRLNWVA